MTFVPFERYSLWKRLFDFVFRGAFDSFSEAAQTIFFGTIILFLGAVTWFFSIPYLIFRFIKYSHEHNQAESTAPGWGWYDSRTSAAQQIQTTGTPYGRDFTDSANKTTSQIFSNALNGQRNRGAFVVDSPQAAQGLPPSS